VLIRLELDDSNEALEIAVMCGHHFAWCQEHGRRPGPKVEELYRQAQAAKSGRAEADIPRSDRDTGTDDHAPAPRPFYSRREAAAIVGKSERQVRRWIADAKLAATVAGIPHSEVERLKGRAHAPA